MKTKTGLRLRAAREASGLSLAALSSKMNSLLSASRISNYEQGTRQMSVDGAISLGKALDVAPSYLLGLDEEINETPQLVGKHQKELFTLLSKICVKGDLEVQKASRILAAYLDDA
jgi:transcriptional regulator with XRE-family HTH domain